MGVPILSSNLFLFKVGVNSDQKIIGWNWAIKPLLLLDTSDTFSLKHLALNYIWIRWGIL